MSMVYTLSKAMTSDDIWCHLMTQHCHFQIILLTLTQNNTMPMEIVNIESASFSEINRWLQNIQIKLQSHTGTDKESLDEWMDNQDVCAMMDISIRKLLTLRQKGYIPFSRIDRKIYYKKKDILIFMEQHLKQK